MRLVFGVLCAVFLALGLTSLWLASPDISKFMAGLGLSLFFGFMIIAQMSQLLPSMSRADHERNLGNDLAELGPTFFVSDDERK